MGPDEADRLSREREPEHLRIALDAPLLELRDRQLFETGAELVRWIAEHQSPPGSVASFAECEVFARALADNRFPEYFATLSERLEPQAAVAMVLAHLDALDQLVDWYSSAKFEEKAFENDEILPIRRVCADLKQYVRKASIEGLHEIDSLRDVVISMRESTLSRVSAPLFQRAQVMDGGIAGEVAEAKVRCQKAWIEARKQGDVGLAMDALGDVVEVTRRLAEKLWELPAYRGRASLYGVLRGIHEPGGVPFGAKALFDDLTPHIQWLRDEVRRTTLGSTTLGHPKNGEGKAYDLEALETQLGGVSTDVYLRMMSEVAFAQGLDPQRTIISNTERPLSWGLEPPNVMILGMGEAIGILKGTIVSKHEAGHLLVYQMSNRLLHGTPYLRGRSCISAGLNESLARIHEICVGTSPEYWECQLPRFAKHFPNAQGLDPHDVARGLLGVSDTPIRVFADPLTYTLMISIRHDLERDLVNGKLSVEDLPDAWNQLHRDRLGIDPPSHTQGVLQDIHWYMGLYGYFPSYSLGDLIATQLYEKMEKDIPDLTEKIRAGNEGIVTGWLAQHVYPHVGLLSASEIVEMATGKPLSTTPFLNFQAIRYARLFGINLPERRPWQDGEHSVAL